MGVVTVWAPCLGEATGCVQESGRALGWALWLDTTIGWTPRIPRVTFQAPWLYGARPEALLTVVHGCWLDFLPTWGYRIGSAAAWVLWQSFLVGWDWKLYSAVGL